MKKLLIFALFAMLTSTIVSCTKEPIVEELKTDTNARGPLVDPVGYGPAVDPMG